jgi:hypothetical protein
VLAGRDVAAHHGRVNSARLRLLAAVLACLWAALIWELCTSTRVTHGHWYWWTPWAFNLGHAPLFGMQAALLGLALAPGAIDGGWRSLLRAVPEPDGSRRAAFLAMAGLAVAYGVLLEWVQSRIPGRTASALDVLMDAVGAFGVPWALSTGVLFGRRAWLVFAVGAALAAWETWGRR